MENPWLATSDSEAEEVECEENGWFYGVFTRPPSEIGSILPRPSAPLLNPAQIAFNSSKFTQEMSFDSAPDGCYFTSSTVYGSDPSLFVY